jgi:hypothetical protein
MALAVVILGPGALSDYVFNVVTHLGQRYRNSWPNLSLSGYWHKLFDGSGTGGHTVSLWHNPLLARVLTAASCLAAAAVAAWAALRARSRAECDRAFGLAITTMLLVSPITWDHYFLLLVLPLTLLWLRVPRWGSGSVVLWVCVVLLWINIGGLTWKYLFPNVPSSRWADPVAQPWQVLTVLSLHTYVLLALFALAALTVQDPEAAAETKEGLTVPATVGSCEAPGPSGNRSSDPVPVEPTERG